MKKVFHIDIHSVGYDASAIGRAFVNLGYEYENYKWQQVRYSHGTEFLRNNVIEKIAAFKPDYIFVQLQNSEVFDKNTWEIIAGLGFVINYSFDARVREETSWMYDIASTIGLTVFSNDDDAHYCRGLGIANVMSSHSSCDMELFKPKENALMAFDVSFVGNKYVGTNLNFPMAQEREDVVAAIQSVCKSNVGLYGLGRPGGLVQAGVEINIYNHSKICLSHNNFYLRGYSSDRLFRIMASGAFCLTKYFPGIEHIFKKEIELDWYENTDELKDLISYYLSNDEERKEIAAAGCKKVREEHTWENRLKTILSNI